MYCPPPPARLVTSAPPGIPTHIGIIMDGNGRWARQHGLTRLAGHRRGVETIRGVTEECRGLGVQILTLYAFSTENWERPRSEVHGLMRLFSRTMDREVQAMHDNGIQIRVIGDRTRLSTTLQTKVAAAEKLTRTNTTAILNVAINYGGRHELITAINRLALAGRDMTLLSELDISQALDTSGMPDPDLIIRTAGEYRLSNFLLWQAAYAELYVTPTLWPEFGRADLEQAVAEYGRRVRKFGMLMLPSESPLP